MPAKTATPKTVTVEFPRTGNAWIDAGIVGLHRVLERKGSYLEPIPDAMRDDVPGSPAFPDVAADLEADRLTVRGPKDQVQRCLERAYECLIECYYSVSTRKQRDEAANHNFYLDPASEEFVTFPKQRAAGAALLMFDKAARPAGTQVKWGQDPTTGKPTPGRLPADYAHLQPKLDALLRQQRMKPGPPAGLLVGAGNKVSPKVMIKVGGKASTDSDFLVGQSASSPGEAKQTAFPLFGGSRSFTNETTTGPRIGWETDFAGKFVPAISFFYIQGDDLFLFFPESPDLRRVADLAAILEHVTAEKDENFFRNFELKLGGYFAGGSEVTFGFLHRVFCELTRRRRSESAGVEISDDEFFAAPAPIDSESVYDAVAWDAPVNFAIVAARKKGNVWMARDCGSFTESLYLARLLDRITTSDARPAGRLRCDPKRLMQSLIDFDAAKDKTLLRDEVCNLVLRKQSPLRLLERHAFHLFSSWSPGDPLMIGPLLDFAALYEPALREGESDVEKQLYDEMVSRAQWLGRNIAEGVCSAGTGTERNESAGRSKGVFFRLRRARKTEDFLNELARLQLRYKIDIPPKALDADCFHDESFAEYRGFCVIAALSRFQYLTGKKGNGSQAGAA